MGITVFPPSTSSGSSGGSEKPYKCIPACGAVAAGDFVSLFPGECVVRSSVKAQTKIVLLVSVMVMVLKTLWKEHGM